MAIHISSMIQRVPQKPIAIHLPKAAAAGKSVTRTDHGVRGAADRRHASVKHRRRLGRYSRQQRRRQHHRAPRPRPRLRPRQGSQSYLRLLMRRP